MMRKFVKHEIENMKSVFGGALLLLGPNKRVMVVVERDDPICGEFNSMATPSAIFPPRRVGDPNICNIELPADTDAIDAGLEQASFRCTKRYHDVGADVKRACILDIRNGTCGKTAQ